MCLPNSDVKTLTATDLTTDVINTNYKNAFKRVESFIPNIELNYIKSTFCSKSYIEGQRSCFIRQNGNIYTILGGKINNVFELFNTLGSL